VLGIGKDKSFEETVGLIDQFDKSTKYDNNVIYLKDRDTPTEGDDVLLKFFDELRLLFRNCRARHLVAWPIPLLDKANRLFELAHKIGGDSLVGTATKPHAFAGPPAESFYKIADDTARLFNDGYGLPEFGIDKDLGTSLFAQADTVAKYFQVLVGHADRLNNVVAGKLVEKPRPRVWVVLCGDEATELNTTVRTLTFGLQRKLDIESLMPALADDQEATQYLKDWKRLGSIAPYLLRTLDVRVVEVPPNVVLAVIRAFANDDAKKDLAAKTEKAERALELLKESMLGELLLQQPAEQRKVPQKTKDDTRAEYVRVQRKAHGQDNLLNAAFGEAIHALLSQEGALVKSVGEKAALVGELRPDIHILYEAFDPVCLEFTWRTTGYKLDNDASQAQNTLTPGHIRKYVLEKVYEYVKALDLGDIKAPE
jgi:hypothetical protein